MRKPPIPVSWFVGPLLILSDVFCVCVSGPLHSDRGPRDVIYFFESYDQQLLDIPFFQSVFSELAHLRTL